MIDKNTIKSRLLKLDTASVSDAMDSMNIFGALYGIEARVPGNKIAGPIFTVKYQDFTRATNTFYNAGNYIDEVAKDEIILIDNNGRCDCTNWGDILTEVALSKKITGTVINGAARDIAYIKEQNYPLFSKAVTMVSGKNRVKLTATQINLEINSINIKPGDWMLADDNGVLVIPQQHVREVLERAENVEHTERLIRQAIANGSPLQEARNQFNYSEPWKTK